MHKVIIIEDDYRNMEMLKDMLLEHFKEEEIIACATNIKEGLQAIIKHEPTLIFLDIHLPDGDGFEILKLTDNLKYKVIFTTAYDQYALQAFDSAPLHYLLKPISSQELNKALRRYFEQGESSTTSAQANAQDELLSNGINNNLQRIAVPSQQDITFIDLQHIIYFEASGSYTHLYLQEQTTPIISSKPIGFYEKLLVNSHFFRIHSKYIINLHCVQKYIKGKGGLVELTNGKQLMVSFRKKNDFLLKMEHKAGN